MCLTPSVPQDNSAAIARQQATQREGQIREGQSNIDNAFSVFDPQYYDKFKQTYENNYFPQVDRQFGLARQGLKYNLARQGTADSTGGQKQFGDLIDSYGNARHEIESNALGATNQLRSSVDSTRGDLYAQNSASADPALSAISATSRAGSLTTPASYSPLGDLFGGLINGGTAYYRGTQQGLPTGYSSLFSPGSGSGGGVRVTN